MVSLDDALAHVLDRCEPLPPVTVPAAGATGLVLAGDVVAAEAVPPFANTAMDGYAVRAADVAGAPVTLPVVGEVAAGHPAGRALGPGEAMRIFTGAPVPDGADAVVMVERTERLDGGRSVRIEVAVDPGTHLRAAGEDLKPGEQVLAAGDEVTPARVGVLASLGVAEVRARPRPRVGVLSTGDELVVGSAPLRPGQIRDSNRPMLLALVAEAGFTPVDLGHVVDDEDAIRTVIERGAATCDAVMSSGGVSMGDIDLVRVVLDRIGDMRWMQVDIRPARPLAFGLVTAPDGRRVPVFGLPGNPVSSLVSFALFARAGLRRIAGHPPGRQHLPRFTAVASEPLARRPDGKVHFVRVVVTAAGGTGHGLAVRSSGGQGSHQLGAMARADGLVVLPDGEGAAAGEVVELLLLGEPAGGKAP
ncbi:MAG TPA: gephyrin-like molybdotransferase Glp [Acidimicrobiales bacterium]|nr:gephyrin-like molybdotransferase Glp [Acidimicrobiales bacterium]